MAVKKRGSKLNKSENAQVRLDPVLKWAAELAAGKERRSLSSYIEMAVELAAKQSMVARGEGGNPVSAWQVAQECWHQEPNFQLGNLAKLYPDLLTIRERKIFDARNQLFDADSKGLACLALKSAQEFWDVLCRYADEEISFKELTIQVHQLRADAIQQVQAMVNP